MSFIFLVGSFIYLGINSWVYAYPEMYFSELRISFLPYWGRVSLFLALWSFFLFLKAKTIRMKWVFITLILSYVLLGIYFFRVKSNFYIDVDNGYFQKQGAGVSFLYANIWYKNAQYNELFGMIKHHDPDILFFVEYAPHHHKVLYPLLHEKYPYINRENPKHAIGGRIIYSKYPIKNLASSFSGDGVWKYGYVSLEKEDKSYIFYLIHTSAPNTKRNFIMRNSQLEKLVKDLTAQYDAREYNTIVTILGDFNLSPRSFFYKNLTKDWQNTMFDMTKLLPGVMTWSLFRKGYVASHIDHIFTNKKESWKTLNLIDVPGSDHKGFIGEI